MTLRETVGLPGQYMKQFQGYTGHHLRAMECLGLVDKDTVRNLTRDFQNIEVEMVVVVFSASSPSGLECALALFTLLTAVFYLLGKAREDKDTEDCPQSVAREIFSPSTGKPRGRAAQF